MKTTIRPKTATWQNITAVAGILFFSFSVSAQPVSNIVKIDTRLCVGTNIVDATVVVFDAAYSNAVDGDDAYKFSNTAENIAIKRGTALLVVEGRQPATGNDEIPFKLWNLRQQTYRLEFIPNNFATTPMMPLLEDNYLQTTTPISKIAVTSVNFTVNSNAASWASNRFRIIFAAAAPLPVRFISIKAAKNAFGVSISWTVAEQVNVKNYEVERSVDGIQFDAVGRVAANTNSSIESQYSFSDNNLSPVTSFYRIKTVDNDGSVKYSSVVKVNGGDKRRNFTVLSNPVTNNVINVQFSNQPAGVYKLAVINAAGNSIMNRNVSYAGGTSNESLSLPGTVSPGICWLQITTPANETELRMLLIGNK